jgi:flagellar protein FlaF
MNSTSGYVKNEIAGMSEAELEIRALINTASALNVVKEHWNENSNSELNKALDKNRRLWSILASAMQEEDCPQPLEIKQNILNLANFIFKRTTEIIANPEPQKLDILININMNIARGLSGKA